MFNQDEDDQINLSLKKNMRFSVKNIFDKENILELLTMMYLWIFCLSSNWYVSISVHLHWNINGHSVGVKSIFSTENINQNFHVVFCSTYRVKSQSRR